MARSHNVPQINLRALLQDPTASIDLKLPAVESSMESFRNALKEYNNKAMEQVSERRAIQTHEKKSLEDKCQHVRLETEKCKMKEIELLETLSREQEERKEAELAVSGLKRQLASLKERTASVEAEIAQLQAFSSNLQRDRQREQTVLDKRGSSLSPELRACEEELAFVIEGVSLDTLLFSWTNIDRSDPDREFTLVLDVSHEDYRVPTSKPLLASLPGLIDKLNDSRDLSAFIIQCRRAFVDLVS